MMKRILSFLIVYPVLVFGQYAPTADEAGTTAIHKDSSAIIAWANDVEIHRGFLDIEDTTFTVGGTNKASYGTPTEATGKAEGNHSAVVSLGDGGEAILYFNGPIINGPGPDFAVFENSFSSTYLELAKVAVSSDGINFVEFPSHSLTQTVVQINGFGSLQAEKLYNLAGKYKGAYGTPFDLEELVDSVGLDLNGIKYIRVTDVVGSIGDSASFDSYGNKINDPYPTPYESGGFDLDGVAALHGFVSVDNFEEINFQVYPNPNNGTIYLNAELEIEGVVIYDLSGKQVLRIKGAGKKMKIETGLPKGSYVLDCIVEGVHSKKMLIVR